LIASATLFRELDIEILALPFDERERSDVLELLKIEGGKVSGQSIATGLRSFT